MRTIVVAVAILSACFMQEVSGGFLAAKPKDTTQSAEQPKAKLMESVGEDEEDEEDDYEEDEEDVYADDYEDDYADDDSEADNAEADEQDEKVNDEDEEPAQADTKAAKDVQTPTKSMEKTKVDRVKMSAKAVQSSTENIEKTKMHEKASLDALKAAQKEDDDSEEDKDDADEMGDDEDEEPAQADTKAAKAVQTPTANSEQAKIDAVKLSELNEKASWDALKAAQKEMMER